MADAPIVAALFVSRKGPYWGDPRCDCWDEERDARNYRGPLPVVAHPPCAAFSKMASLRELRYGLPAGIDGGCFASAVQSVFRWGGCLGHPAESTAWDKHGLTTPEFGEWTRLICGLRTWWVTEVWQVDYGHRARKRTWLLYAGANPPAPMLWLKKQHTACVSGSKNHTNRPVGDRNRVWHSEAIKTPLAFAETLIQLAANSRGT